MSWKNAIAEFRTCVKNERFPATWAMAWRWLTAEEMPPTDATKVYTTLRSKKMLPDALAFFPAKDVLKLDGGNLPLGFADKKEQEAKNKQLSKTAVLSHESVDLYNKWFFRMLTSNLYTGYMNSVSSYHPPAHTAHLYRHDKFLGYCLKSPSTLLKEEALSKQLASNPSQFKGGNFPMATLPSGGPQRALELFVELHRLIRTVCYLTSKTRKHQQPKQQQEGKTEEEVKTEGDMSPPGEATLVFLSKRPIMDLISHRLYLVYLLTNLHACFDFSDYPSAVGEGHEAALKTKAKLAKMIKGDDGSQKVLFRDISHLDGDSSSDSIDGGKGHSVLDALDEKQFVPNEAFPRILEYSQHFQGALPLPQDSFKFEDDGPLQQKQLRVGKELPEETTEDCLVEGQGALLGREWASVRKLTRELAFGKMLFTELQVCKQTIFPHALFLPLMACHLIYGSGARNMFRHLPSETEFQEPKIGLQRFKKFLKTLERTGSPAPEHGAKKSFKPDLKYYTAKTCFGTVYQHISCRLFAQRTFYVVNAMASVFRASVSLDSTGRKDSSEALAVQSALHKIENLLLGENIGRKISRVSSHNPPPAPGSKLLAVFDSSLLPIVADMVTRLNQETLAASGKLRLLTKEMLLSQNQKVAGDRDRVSEDERVELEKRVSRNRAMAREIAAHITALTRAEVDFVVPTIKLLFQVIEVISRSLAAPTSSQLDEEGGEQRLSLNESVALTKQGLGILLPNLKAIVKEASKLRTMRTRFAASDVSKEEELTTIRRSIEQLKSKLEEKLQADEAVAGDRGHAGELETIKAGLLELRQKELMIEAVGYHFEHVQMLATPEVERILTAHLLVKSRIQGNDEATQALLMAIEKKKNEANRDRWNRSTHVPVHPQLRMTKHSSTDRALRKRKAGNLSAEEREKIREDLRRMTKPDLGNAIDESKVYLQDNGPKQLIVNHLPLSIRDRELKKLFWDEVGPVEHAKIAVDRSKFRPQGFGFVYFYYSKHAEKAIEMMNGYRFEGKELKVDYAVPQRPFDGRRKELNDETTTPPQESGTPLNI